MFASSQGTSWCEKNHRLHSLPLFVVRNSKHPKSKQTDMYKITFCLKNNMSTVKCEKWNPGCRKSQVMMYDTLITCILITRFHRINSIINESYNSCFEAMNVAIIVVRHKAYIGQAPSSAKDHFCWGVRCTVPRGRVESLLKSAKPQWFTISFSRGTVAEVGNGIVRTQDGTQNIGMHQDQESATCRDLLGAPPYLCALRLGGVKFGRWGKIPSGGWVR